MTLVELKRQVSNGDMWDATQEEFKAAMEVACGTATHPKKERLYELACRYYDNRFLTKPYQQEALLRSYEDLASLCCPKN